MFRSVIASLLFISCTSAQVILEVPPLGEPSTSFNGSSFDNCVEITPNYNFHWTVDTDADTLIAAHEALPASSNMYFAWAVVADQDAPNRMAGSDAVITSFAGQTALADDYLFTAVAGCDVDTGLGVCTDDISGVGMDNADPTLLSVMDVNGFMQDGIHGVTYTRSLLAADAQDLPIDITANLSYIFAFGPLQGNGLAGFHAGGTRTAVAIQLDRTPAYECSQIQPVLVTTPDETIPPVTTAATTTAEPTETPVPSSASVVKPEFVMAALAMGAALL